MRATGAICEILAMLLAPVLAQLSFLERPALAAASLYVGFVLTNRLLGIAVADICTIYFLICIMGFKKGLSN
jgi:hypothetical protein